MRLKHVSRNGLSLASDAVVPRAVNQWHDIWDTESRTRTIIDLSGARTTFTYDVQSHTVVQFPTGGRATLAWCQSQKSSSPATLSQFGAHVELRSNLTLESTDAQVGAFLAHPESQCQVGDASKRALRAASKRRRWLDDVVQQANLKLLGDLRRGKLVFRGDDPERFVRWFRGAIRHAVADAIRFCLSGLGDAGCALITGEVPDPNPADPAEIAMLLELGRMAVDEIERIHEVELHEIMRDLHDGKSTRESAARLGISKPKAGKLRKRGCQLVADRLNERAD
jgi:DNA-directed RNA polymerase specialized sigma24 family protein